MDLGSGRWVGLRALVLVALCVCEAPARGGERPTPATRPPTPAASTDSSLEPLTRDLRSDSLPARVAAADALGRLGPAAKPAIPAMLEAMNSPQAWSPSR
jgi:hypothetical protein